ncbi:zinc finger protein 62-like [Leptidea sinapis]|uniref:zinc finger protein 62-like n=1 Tax=Leptidea sinapis TaxID=189913 RepID=UPI0021C29916|nr:zinc finger protein 62-like [Leptidea sinapis]
MNEININIEGYNVNGICVGCLCYKRKMFSTDEIKYCFKLLGDIDVPDGLTIQVCWECKAAVDRICKFQQQIQYSYNILINYSRKHPYLLSPDDLSKYSSTRLCCDYTTHAVEDLNVLDKLVKSENEDNLNVDQIGEEAELSPKIKYEPEDGIPSDYDNDVKDFSPASSDDDNMLLVNLKKKVKKEEKTTKKSKKKKKETQKRRLKNLPGELIQLHTMSEAEMWIVREQDMAAEAFVSLKYKCMDCLRSYNTQKLRDDHMNSKHTRKKENTHQCDICKGYFISKDNLSLHKERHLSAYKCRECGLVSTMKIIIMDHECAKRKGFTCDLCDMSFTSNTKLSYHRNVSHEQKPQCDCCGKVFANKITLGQHIRTMTSQNSPKEKLYLPCSGCNKIFNSKKSLRSHVSIHEGIKYPCQICGKLFQWKRNLARHMRNHRERNNGMIYKCHECGKNFSSRDCYNNHMKLSKKHVSESALEHACQYCSKKFASKWCLVDHVDWEHLKRFKYRCSVCYKPFKTAKIMVAHVNNIHERKNKLMEQESEHLCEICGKSYKTAKRLKGHVWAMHTKRSGTKSYKCELCSASFTWQTSIYKHMRMMHDNCKRKLT